MLTSTAVSTINRQLVSNILDRERSAQAGCGEDVSLSWKIWGYCLNII